MLARQMFIEQPAYATAIPQSTLPVDLIGTVELGQEQRVQLEPDSGLMPATQIMTAGLAAAAAQIAGQIVPGDMEDKFLDMPPAEGAALKKAMNILPDYFTATIEDPTPAKLTDIMDNLRSLLR